MSVPEGLRARFEQIFGAAPTGVWSAPGRVNLIGEHTDYNGGLVLPIALPHRTYAAVSPRSDSVLRVASLQAEGIIDAHLDQVGPGRPAGWAAYVAGVPWALREEGYAVSGLDVLVDGQVPLGAGLSSSAALECAVGAAVSDLSGLGLLASDAGRATLAAACVRAENEVAGAPTGGMDQSASLRCQPGHALLLDCSTWRTSAVPVDLDAAGLVLLVVDTRAHHALTDGQYGSRREQCERAAALLEVQVLREVTMSMLPTALAALPNDVLRRRTRHVVTEIDRVQQCVAALQAGDFDTIGALFLASHASLRDDFEVSCAELDAVVEETTTSGALGARMTGGGFGGSAIALVPAGELERCVGAVQRRFATQGWAPPAAYVVTPSAPAGRDA